MNKELAKLTANESRVVDDKILQGVVSRASTLAFIFAAAFSIYSVTSLSFLRTFDQSLTLFENTWPRIIFNGIPLTLLGLFFRSYTEKTKLKAWIWTTCLPLIFLIACLIHVWPMIWSGQTQVYFFVHSANVFIMSTTLVVVAPPPKLILAQTLCFIAFIAGPIALLFWHAGDFQMLQYELGDLLIVIPVSAYISLVIYRLRLKIAIFDLQLKRLASPFLGATLTDAIYNQKSELLQNRRVDGVVVQIDIRGYTKFYHNTDPAIVKSFMISFHNLVIRIVGQNAGYWHKSVGDAHIFSFGAMDGHDELSEIPGVEKELSSAILRKKRHHVETAITSIFAITEAFNDFKRKYDIDDNVVLGVGVASGELEVRVQGDDEFRKELDIDGSAVIRAARLEEFSKTIRKNISPNDSIVVLAPELFLFVEMDASFKKWDVVRDGGEVRSFPEINFVYYRLITGKIRGDGKTERGAA